MRHSTTLLTILLLAVSLVVSGCSRGSGGGLLERFNRGSQKADGSDGALSPGLDAADGDVAKLYNAGLSELQNGNFKRAQKEFGEVERQHPYSKWATKAILMQAFAAYQRNAYDEATNAANRFIALHPGHKDAPYAHYMKALSEYERISDARRDQKRTVAALDSLEEIANRYPDSRYAADAKAKALLARDRLAAKEMEVGRYYLKRNSYTAAINRFKNVVENYQASTQTPEALYRLAECYLALGVVSEAQTAAAVLGHNFPTSQWYRDAYQLVSSDGTQPLESSGSWISRAFNRS